MFSWRYYRVRRTTLIVVLCVAFLIGLALPKLQVIVTGFGIVVLACVLLLGCARRLALLAVPAVILSGLLFGLWRGSDAQAALNQYQQYVGHGVVLRGVVREDTTYDDKGKLDVRIGSIHIGEHQLPGVVRVTTLQAVQPKRGDIVQVEGTLREGFGNYQAAVYYASLTVEGERSSWIEDMRRHFTASILTILPEPQASLGLGFLVGLKSQLPDELSDQLKLLGLTHIVVASGYNLTILVRLSRRMFARFSNYQAVAVAGLLIAGFVTITGFSASMSRAALVTSLALAAWYYGRRIHPVVLLLVASAITAAVNPLFLWSDLGWWLSFLAFGGVMLGAPLVQQRLFGDKQPRLLTQVIIETTCAQLLTLPLILFVFGDFAVLALLANVLIVPLIPLVMLLTFVAGVAGWAIPAFAGWVAMPALWVLGYMTGVTDVLSQIPWANVSLPITAAGMLLLYATVVTIGWVMYKKLRYNYLQSNIIE